MFELLIGIVVGWFILPAPMFVTNFWKRIFGQKEIRPK